MEIIIHGGFFSEASQSLEIKTAKQDSLLRIVRSAYTYLQDHTAVETCVYAIKLLEDDPLFNAGTGSMIQADGAIRMSASIMDGQTLKFSGVINIQNVQNPISIAAELMKEDDRVLGGEPAIRYARGMNVPIFNPETTLRRAEYNAKKASLGMGTVGAVVRDSHGYLAAATSTGGKGFEIPGRISDSATTAGNYANKHAGISMTGVGEDIVSLSMASKIVTRVTDGTTISSAFQKSFQELSEIDGFAGAIGIDARGNICHQCSHPQMVFASYDGKTEQVFT